jgi:hypothetical protein
LNIVGKPDGIPEPWLSFLRDLDASATEEIRMDCMGGFVMTLVYGFSRTTGDIDVLVLAPREAGRPLFELGMQGGPLHKKHKIYLDYVGVANVPEDYEQRLIPFSPGTLKISGYSRSILMIWLYQSWRGTINATETTFST